MIIENIDKVIKEMTLKEKVTLLVGYKSFNTLPIERLGIPTLSLSDGPNGLRKEDDQKDNLTGIACSLPATCFPVGATVACSWNKENFYNMGKAIAQECKRYGTNILLGPAINIKRNPLCGRNFEYLSEDPYLTGVLGSEIVKGIQDQGVGACVKHFACNNNENYRYNGDSIVDERALREIYLKPFEMVVKNAKPWALMTAYNQVNGSFASENYHIQKEILRDEWGFDGISMTDWGGGVDRVKGLIAGTDLEMPGMINHNVQRLVDGLKNNEISISLIDESVRRILTAINRTEILDKTCDLDANNLLAADIATDSAVLLENDGILPLNKNEKYLVIGDLFNCMRYQGSGSSLLNPYKFIDHKDVFKERNIRYDFVRGYKESEFDTDLVLQEEALNKAQDADTILYYCGLNDYIESEGFDRKDMKLPQNQLVLLNELLKLGKKIVVVLFGGSSIELPFAKRVNAILNMMLPGQAGGEATTRLLFGEACPNGRLMETWMKSYSCVPFGNEFVENPIEKYKESIYVGYRYYLSANKMSDVLYPFGYGLSYTSFEISRAKIKEEENKYIIKVDVKNTGRYAGAEVVQIYVSRKSNDLFHPLRELKSFGKVYLEPGETKELVLEVLYEDLRSFDVHRNTWIIERGEYSFEIGLHSDNILLVKSFMIAGNVVGKIYSDEIKNYYFNPENLTSVTDEAFEELIGYKLPVYVKDNRPYTLETPIGEFNTRLGRMFKNIAIGIGMKQYKNGCKMPDGPEKERNKKTGLFVARMMESNSIRSLMNSSSGILKYNYAQAILELANGHFFKAIFKLMKKDRLKIRK